MIYLSIFYSFPVSSVSIVSTRGLKDPSQLFSARRGGGVAGVAVFTAVQSVGTALALEHSRGLGGFWNSSSIIIASLQCSNYLER